VERERRGVALREELERDAEARVRGLGPGDRLEEEVDRDAVMCESTQPCVGIS